MIKKRFLSMLVLLAAVVTGAVAQTTYKVSVKSGTEDADKWEIAPAEATTAGVAAGTTVTATYSGTKKVKSVKAKKKAAPAATDLSTINADYTASDGEILTGTLASNVKISIADGATVTLNNVTINGTNDDNYEWAGITCLGNATINLSGTNTVKGFWETYPGIYVPVNKTVTIQGTGSLTASSNGWGAGIGGGYRLSSGNVLIKSGTIVATGGHCAAGIGSGGSDENAPKVNCGTITITGGDVTATGGTWAAGIGSGGADEETDSICGDITITNTVTRVTATKGNNAPNSIGAGLRGTCGTITIEDPSKVTQN